MGKLYFALVAGHAALLPGASEFVVIQRRQEFLRLATGEMMERATNRDAALPSPSEIEAIDKRRQWGLNFLVISGQFGFFAILLTLWSGQDLTYSPASIHPMFYYNAFCFLLAAGFGLYGSYLRRGQPEF